MGKLHTSIKDFLDYFRTLVISSQCSSIRSDLTMLVTDDNVFSEVITEQLKPAAHGVPYHIDPDDPEQIATIKKISNILYNVETIVAELEQIELTDDMYTVELAQHAPKVFKNAYSAINQIYDAIQLINNSSASIQAMMPSQFEMLQDSCSYLSQKLNQFSNSKALEEVEQTLENTIRDTLERLPTERVSTETAAFSDICKVLMDIPGYISNLQNIIKSESLFPEALRFESPEDYKERVGNKAKLLAHSLEGTVHKTGIEQSAQILSTLKMLNNLSIDIINTNSAMTKEAYMKSLEKLNYLKHDLIPEMISELESVEENLGLKSGTLTKPALEAAESYYKQLAIYIDVFPPIEEYIEYYRELGNEWYLKALRESGKIIHKRTDFPIDTQINTLMDTGFREKRRELQAQRLFEAQTQVHETEQSLKATKAFFQKMNSLNTFYNNGQFSNISIKDKQELAFLYQQFQAQMAAINPNLDAKTVGFLNLTEQEKEQLSRGKQESSSIFQSLWSGVSTTSRYTMLIAQKMAEGSAPTLAQPEKEFATILNSEEKIFKLLRRELATKQQRVTLIESTLEQVEKANRDYLGKDTNLQLEVTLPQVTEYQYVSENKQAKEIHLNILRLDYQIEQIDEAQRAFAQMINKLNEINGENKIISSLSKEKKEELKSLYKQVQPYICLLGKIDPTINKLNTRIVSTLMSDTPVQDDTTIHKIFDSQSKIQSYLNQFKLGRELDKEECAELEEKTRKQPPTPITLDPMKVTTRNTLLSQLSQLKLSDKIHDFLHKKIIPFLQENLSQEILNELNLKGNLSQLKPYIISNEDASQVSLYKNLINSFIHLEQALRGFESKGGHEYTDSTISQALFLGTTTYSVAGAISKTFKAVTALKGNTQLQALLQQGMDIITPLKQLPGITTLFESGSEKAPEEKNTDPNVTIATTIYQLQRSLLHLVKDFSPLYLHERYLELKNDFIEKNASQLSEAELALGLEKGSLLTKLNAIFDNTEQLIKEELEVYSLLLGGSTHPEWEKINPLYDQLNEALKQDPVQKKQIAEIYGQLREYLDEELTEDFISRINDTEELIAATEQLLATEKTFNPIGALGTLQNAFYYEDMDFSKESAQQMFRENYASLQPYLETIDQNYYTSTRIATLKTPEDYERVLAKIAKDNSKKLSKVIEQHKTNSIYSLLLSQTHQLRSFVKENQKEVLSSEVQLQTSPESTDTTRQEHSISQQEALSPQVQLQTSQESTGTTRQEPSISQQEALSPQVQLQTSQELTGTTRQELSISQQEVLSSEVQLQTSQESSSRPTSSTLKNLIDGFYKLQKQASEFIEDSNPSQILEDKQDLENAIEAIKRSYANLDVSLDSITSFLTAINQLEVVIHNTQVENRQLIIENIKNIRTQFAASIIKKADDAEFTLGLKPGALSSSVSAHFDKFYKRLLDRVVKNDDQHNLLLLVDTSPTEQRIKYEKERVETLKAVKPLNKAEEKTKSLNIKNCEHRIIYLEKLLKEEKNEKTPKKIEEFKEHKFDQYIKGLLRETLGSYTDAFYKEIKPSLTTLQKQILKDITINDNIEEKIANSSHQEQFIRIMSEITHPQTLPTEQNSKLKQSYEQFFAANQQLKKIKEIRRLLEQKVQGNLLVYTMIKDIELFEKNIDQFSINYQPGTDLRNHQDEVTNYLNVLENYKLLTSETFLNQYLIIKSERQLLVNAANTHGNPAKKQKLEFMAVFEEHILKCAKNLNQDELIKKFENFNTVLADHDKTIKIYEYNQKLINTLQPLAEHIDESTTMGKRVMNKFEFATKMNEILVNPTSAPSKKLTEIAAHLSTLQEPKASFFDKVELFFNEIIKTIHSIVTGDTNYKKEKTATSSFSDYKQGIKNILSQNVEQTVEQTVDLNPVEPRNG